MSTSISSTMYNKNRLGWLRTRSNLFMWLSRKSFQINVCYNLRYGNEHLDIFNLRIMLNIQRSNYLLILTIISDKTNNVMRLDLSCLVNLLPNSFICGNKLWHNLNGDYIHKWKIPLNGYFGEYWNPLSLGFLHSSPIFWIRYHKKVLYHFIT